jgi:hypothetical protein
MILNLPLASIIVLAYFNLVWQIMLWTYDLLHPVLGFMLVFFFPVIAGVVIYLVVCDSAGESWTGPVLVSTILFPILYSVSYATRTPDYIKYVHSGGDVFAGRPSEIDSSEHLYYSLENSLVKAEEYGASYSSNKPRQSTTTYSKHFALPVFDAATGERQNAWICSSYSSGLRIDDGKGGTYGLKETELKGAFGTGVIHGRRIVESNCFRAVANYLEKSGLQPIERPLVIDLEKEPAAEYYRKARIHFWILTGILNALFITLFVFVYRANRTSPDRQ